MGRHEFWRGCLPAQIVPGNRECVAVAALVSSTAGKDNCVAYVFIGLGGDAAGTIDVDGDDGP